MSNVNAFCGPRPHCPPPPDRCPPPAGGALHGTRGDDTVHIAHACGLAGAMGLYEVTLNGRSQLMTRQQLEATEFKLGNGNDTLLVDADVTASIRADGGKGNDVMIGGSGNDQFQGGKGNDILIGRGGNDRLHGGKGHDLVLGGRGNDTLQGGKGNDWLLGGRGNDHVNGGRGNDHLYGGRGNDSLDGGRGRDDVRGGPGHDNQRFDWHDLLPPLPHRLLSGLFS